MTSVLNSTSSLRIKALGLARKQVCKSGYRQIKCCDLDIQNHNGNENFEKDFSVQDPDSGKWMPSGWKGECGHKTSLEHITGGIATRLGDYPYMALLGYLIDGETYYLCGGSILNRKYILTAAHCHSLDQPIRAVVIGEHTIGKTEPPPKTYAVEKVIQHPEWNLAEFYNGNDIALIRVKGLIKLFSVDGNSIAVPICLPWPSEDIEDIVAEQRLIVTGWGRTSNKKNITDENLEKYQAASGTMIRDYLPLIGEDTCKKSSGSVNYSIQICAGAQRGRDSCKGDSGGPMVFREFSGDPYYQVGIVSFGTKTCGIGKPTIATRVTAFLEWIQANLEP